MKTDTYYQRQRCSPTTVVSCNIRFMRIFAGVPWKGVSNDSWVIEKEKAMDLPHCQICEQSYQFDQTSQVQYLQSFLLLQRNLAENIKHKRLQSLNVQLNTINKKNVHWDLRRLRPTCTFVMSKVQHIHCISCQPVLTSSSSSTRSQPGLQHHSMSTFDCLVPQVCWRRSRVLTDLLQPTVAWATWSMSPCGLWWPTQ